MSASRRTRLAALALVLALASRVLVLAVAFRSAATAPPRPEAAATWEKGGAVGPLLRWDAGYYLQIAERGYSQDAPGTATTAVAFFPVYPALVRVVARVLAAFGIDLAIAAVLISNLAFLAAVPIAAVAAAEAAQARAQAQPSSAPAPARAPAADAEQVGLLTAALLAFAPGAAFASFAYTEGLFLLLVALALLLLGRGRILAAATVSAVATGTRVTGLAIAAAVTLAAWRARRERPVTAIAAPAISVLGLAAFAAFLAIRFGSPFAFVSAAASWGRSPAHALVEVVRAPARSVLHFLKAEETILDLDPWILALSLVLLAYGRRRLPVTWTALGAVGILLPMVSGLYNSILRYAFPLVPLSASLALRLERAPRAARLVAVILSAAGLAAITWRYARWAWAG